MSSSIKVFAAAKFFFLAEAKGEQEAESMLLKGKSILWGKVEEKSFLEGSLAMTLPLPSERVSSTVIVIK